MADLLDRLKTALSDRYTIESEIGRGGMALVLKTGATSKYTTDTASVTGCA